MARAKSAEQGRIKSKAAAVDEANRGIEKLKGLIAQIEDLSREGFPYRDAVRARTELSLRETIRRIFGEKSDEYQTHKTHKLRTGYRSESVQTIAMLKQLVSQLEQQKSDLLGVKRTSGEPPAAAEALRTADTPTLQAVPSPDTVVAAEEKKTTCRTIQPNNLTKPLAAIHAIASDTSQALQPVTEKIQTASSHQADGPEVRTQEPLSCATTTTAVDRHSALPDSEHSIGHGSSHSDAIALGGPVGSQNTEPIVPAASQVRIPGPPSLTPVAAESAVIQDATETTKISVSIGTDAAPPAVSPVPPSAQMPPPQSARTSAPEQTQPATESIGSVVENNPLTHLPHALPAANETHPGTSAYAGDPPRMDGLAPAETTASGHHSAHSDHSSVLIPKQKRDFSDPVFHSDDPLAALRKVCTRFHLVARQLRLRRDYRATLEIEDEYDVQDLLYALLRLEFEEVGSEDWCPGYGDGAARTSYLLHKERVVIVAKKTKTGVTARELAEQVRIDSSHYSGRADCRTLVCFVYDPEGRIGNPRGLESDLTTVSDAFTVEVIIAPK